MAIHTSVYELAIDIGNTLIEPDTLRLTVLSVLVDQRCCQPQAAVTEVKSNMLGGVYVASSLTPDK